MSRRPLLPTLVLGLSLAVFGFGCASEQGGRKLTPREQAALFVEAAAGALKDNDLVAALQALAEAENLDSDFAPIYNARASVYFLRKEYPAALEQAKKSVQVDPTYSIGLITLGKILLDQGKLDEAVAPLEKASRDPLNREAFKAFTHLGVIRYRQKRFEEAQKDLDRAIELAPNQACLALYYRGHLKLREDHFKEAIRDYSGATRRLCGSFSDAHMALATAYERSGQFELARKKYVEIQQVFSNTEIADRAMERLRALP